MKEEMNIVDEIVETINKLTDPLQYKKNYLCVDNEIKPNIKWCEKHEEDNGGVRNCLLCGCEEMSRALSRIDYLAGEPNEYQVSSYDVFPDPSIVTGNVEKKINELNKIITSLKKKLSDTESKLDDAFDEVRYWKNRLNYEQEY